MPDDTNNPRLDDALADYTDRLLSQAKNDAEPGPPPEDEELAGLQQTVLKLKQATPNQPPPPSLVARLRLALFSEYRRTMQEHSTPASARPWWKRLVDGLHSPRGLAPRLALVLVTVLLIFFLLSTENNTQPGAAGLSSYTPWISLALALIGLAIVFVLLREKK